MTKKELTAITVKHEARPIRTEQWDLMPVGTTFVYPVDHHLCIKISAIIMFDLEDKVAFDVVESKHIVWDFGREDPIDFELVDISISAKQK